MDRALRLKTIAPARQDDIWTQNEDKLDLVDKMLAINDHVPDEMMELYALGRLAEDLVPSLEEHLLVCAKCQEALREEDVFSQSLVAGLTWNQNSAK
jgi:hypothetical protein